MADLMQTTAMDMGDMGATATVDPTALTTLMVGAYQTALAAASASAVIADSDYCNGNDYDDSDLGVRISSIFVILVGGMFGALFPVIAKTFTDRRRELNPGQKQAGILSVLFFFAKYFGAGVIVATAFIHLLAPANDELGSKCIDLPDYPWPEGIALMMVFALFLVELVVMRSGAFAEKKSTGVDSDGSSSKMDFSDIDILVDSSFQQNAARRQSIKAPAPGEDHLGHQRDHFEADGADGITQPGNSEKITTVEDGHKHEVNHASYDDYAAQMTAIFILEFGVIFHSIFIGLTLAVTSPGNSFTILYVVLVFHQTFEGMGLGTRLAMTPWNKSVKGKVTPYLLAIAYGFTTPITIAIGLGVRETFQPNSPTALIVTGVFDSISAGILLYTGLVELMAHEFMFSNSMQTAKPWVVMVAFLTMSAGAGLMALLGKWA